MIFEDHAISAFVNKTVPVKKTAGELLAACAIEAERQANALVQVDRALGEALLGGSPDTDLRTLQLIDLIRQELSGLSGVLQLVAEEGSPENIIDVERLTARVPVAAQLDRLMSQLPNRGSNL